MARYIREVTLNQPDDFVQYIVSDFLGKHGFQLVEFKGEQVYRAGGGLIEIPKFLVWGYQNGVFHVEAWTRNLWLPGVYGKENAMTGFMGCIPKEAYRTDIESLIGLLFQPLNNTAPNQGMQANQGTAPNQGMQANQGMAPGQNPGGAQTVYVQSTDMSKYATMSLVFAIIGIVLAFLSPILGVILGALGITYGKKAMNSPKKGMATAAFVIGIIAVVISIIMWILNFLVLML